MFLFCFLLRYLQKARYKKHQKKADKSTNVFSVTKKGKNSVAAPTTTNNKAATCVSNNVSSGGVTFVIPKIEQPEEPPETTTATATTNCKPSEPNNITFLGTQSTISTYFLPKQSRCRTTRANELYKVAENDRHTRIIKRGKVSFLLVITAENQWRTYGGGIIGFNPLSSWFYNY